MTIGDAGDAYVTGFTTGVPQEAHRPTVIVISSDYETWTQSSLPDEMIGPEGGLGIFRLAIAAAGLVTWGDDGVWFREFG